MPRREESPEHRVSLRERAMLIARGFRSMISRYPNDFAHALRLRSDGVATPAICVEPWPQTSDQPGLRAACWLGHCSVLLKIGGLTILTDPVLGAGIGPLVGGMRFGPRRLTGAVPPIQDLPRPDVILISHAHFDHLDKPTLKTLASEQTSLITARRTRTLIPPGFRRVHELQWMNSLEIEGIHVKAVQPRHWGARSGWDRHRGYNSYILEHAGARVLFAADTADTHQFDSLGPFDLGIFGIGAYDPWHHAHATPEQVWRMARDAECRQVLPVHYLTFKLSDEPLDEPLRRLLTAAGPERHRVVAAPPGAVVTFEPGVPGTTRVHDLS